MPSILVVLLYLLFGLSGAAALVYQVVWVRSLTLVFGGSHLAVTAVLSIFMAGLALGGRAIGKRVDLARKPLRLYGLLELGIGLSALVSAVLMPLYPSLYGALAQGRDAATVYLTIVRILFSVVVLIVPTMLMGATLPVMSSVVSRQPERLRRYLGFLYAVNTLGGAIGAVLSGFVLLRLFGVTATMLVAVATNATVGLICLRWSSRSSDRRITDGQTEVAAPDGDAQPAESADETNARLARLVLWGIGLSGFCALGYEVLWTRVLVLGIGATVYGFTIILAAFLTGIAMGSEGYGAIARLFKSKVPTPRSLVGWFGLTQVAIGATALLVTIYLRDIPVNAVRIWDFVVGSDASSFSSRIWTNFLLAFLYIVVPAIFMGAAFPLAGEALAKYRKATGRGVGDTLAANTVGAILGAAVSGLWLIRWLGIERSLEILTIVNIGVGLYVLAALRRSRWLPAAAGLATVGAASFLALNPSVARIWDRNYFAIFRSNQPEAFRTPALVQEALQNTDVLFYAEGTESIVSVIKVKGGEPAFVTNGRVEASSHAQARQVQFLLGHLPALLARDPREVLVVGMGSGMTAGATVVHPTVEQVTLAEIEPEVRGVARVFSESNHRVLDNPKLNVVVNDGRNFLQTTKRTFDVITADPIHPWFKGAGYLYTREYFALASTHLRPGGVAAQWLPLYELTPSDLMSVVKTFQQAFAHTMLWRTHYDAVLVGSNSPFAIDEAALARRMAEPIIADDLRAVGMGSATALLSYCVMGTDGMTRFSGSGTVNTDDRLYLEFSAPFSFATPAVMAANVNALAAFRENILPYLAPATDAAARADQKTLWEQQLAAGTAMDHAAALFLGRSTTSSAVAKAVRQLGLDYPSYAPGLALASEYQTALSLEPRLLEQSTFNFMGDDGKPMAVEISAVLVPVNRNRASVMFVDNRARTVYGQAYLDDYDREGRAHRFAWDVMVAVQAAYDRDAVAARSGRKNLPQAPGGLRNISSVIESMVKSAQPGS